MKKVVFKTNEAAANQSGAMEADTISKNGAISKSLMSRGNFLIRNLSVALCTLGVIFSGCSKDDDGSGLQDAPTAVIANGNTVTGSATQTSELVGYKSISANVGGITANASIDANGNFSLVLPTPPASSLGAIDGSKNNNNKVFSLETFTISTETAGVQRSAIKNVSLQSYTETSTDISFTAVYFFYIATAVKVKETDTDTRDGIKVTVELNLNLLPGWNCVIATLKLGKDGKSGSFTMRTGPVPSGVKWQ